MGLALDGQEGKGETGKVEAFGTTRKQLSCVYRADISKRDKETKKVIGEMWDVIDTLNKKI